MWFVTMLKSRAFNNIAHVSKFKAVLFAADTVFSYSKIGH